MALWEKATKDIKVWAIVLTRWYFSKKKIDRLGEKVCITNLLASIALRVNKTDLVFIFWALLQLDGGLIERKGRSQISDYLK